MTGGWPEWQTRKARDDMSKKAFDKVAEGLTEALAIAKGEKKPAKLHIPPELDVSAIRTKIGLSQDDFATAFGFTVNQIRDWEQGRSRPLGGVRAYLMIIDRDPKGVLNMLRAVKTRRVSKAA
jgi:putative transcriptional regulator